MAVSFTNMTADGQTSTFKSSAVPANDIGVWFHCSGTFGGGTIKVQFFAADGTWKDLAGASYTEASEAFLSVSAGTTLRADLSGSSGASLYAEFSDLARR